jgi:hypothetical protein
MSESHADSQLELAERGLDGDRRTLAGSPDMTPQLAKVLLRKGDQDTLYALAANPATPPLILRKLAKAVRRGKLGTLFPRTVPSPELARRLAANPSLPRQPLLERTRSGRWDVRATALCNPAVPSSVVRQRIVTEVWGVGAVVATVTTDAELLRLLLPSSERVRLSIAANPEAPADVLAALLDEAEPYVTAVVARHPRLPDELATRILSSGDAPAWVLRPLAENPALPASLRERAAARAGVAPGNPRFDPLTCVEAPDVVDSVSTEDWYEVAAGRDRAQWSALWRVRACLAARQTNGTDAERFVVDPHPTVRLAVLSAPLSVTQIDELVSDADIEVGLRATAVHDALTDDQKAPTSYGRVTGRKRR